MKKIIAMIFLLMMPVSFAVANISVSPFYVKFDGESKKRSATVRFTNSGNEKKSYNIKIINYKQKSNGDYEEIKEPLPGNPFADNFIEYSPHFATLEPKKSQTIRLQRKSMAISADGEYVSHLSIQELPQSGSIKSGKNTEGLKIEIKTVYGVTIPIIVRKGELKSEAKITKAEFKKIKDFEHVNVTVTRSGTKSFYGTLVITQNDKEIGRLNTFRIFVSIPKRTLEVPISKKSAGKIKISLIDEETKDEIDTLEI